MINLNVVATFIFAALILGVLTYWWAFPEMGYWTADGFVQLTPGVDYPTLVEWLNPFSDLSKYE